VHDQHIVQRNGSARMCSARRDTHAQPGTCVIRKTIRVLLVDDHALVRRAFRRVIEDDPAITVVGEAGNGAEAIQMARDLRPAVVLMDCFLPGMNGLLAAGQIMKSLPHTAVLMCSMHSEEIWVRRAIEAGARGYILKSTADFELAPAIKRVVAGERVFAPSVAGQDQPTAEIGYKLSARELEILQFIVDGKSNNEIASQLGLSASTVSSHRTNIMNRLKIHKTAKLVAYALRNGLANIL
jgi:two-component system, NarL family, response regulator NreC